MKLTDAISYLRSTSDQTHKFWGYYQAVTAAVVAFAWSTNNPPTKLLFGLIIAYLIFSFLNCRLIASSQAAALVIWSSIQSYKGHSAEILPAQFAPLLELNKPDNPRLVVSMHFTISILASLAMLARIKY
jgi:hypothetical protein